MEATIANTLSVIASTVAILIWMAIAFALMTQFRKLSKRTAELAVKTSQLAEQASKLCVEVYEQTSILAKLKDETELTVGEKDGKYDIRFIGLSPDEVDALLPGFSKAAALYSDESGEDGGKEIPVVYADGED